MVPFLCCNSLLAKISRSPTVWVCVHVCLLLLVEVFVCTPIAIISCQKKSKLGRFFSIYWKGGNFGSFLFAFLFLHRTITVKRTTEKRKNWFLGEKLFAFIIDPFVKGHYMYFGDEMLFLFQVPNGTRWSCYCCFPCYLLSEVRLLVKRWPLWMVWEIRKLEVGKSVLHYQYVKWSLKGIWRCRSRSDATWLTLFVFIRWRKKERKKERRRTKVKKTPQELKNGPVWPLRRLSVIISRLSVRQNPR